ncbi:hypothetical protein L227DRAFT_617826 [Lentinus tigrinus ALCF2SS1-6]|uniref:Uncharacterized protein n=1 Tax=Lentinus tigrinus ALCF2SS1-6 TaxID=1328759 RepID=A0A5C2RLA3_9APHY|nr:hypothetical protein L227DRAFT_617826 [Lentinus tigrinus ALCF2SS1-6]
MATLSSRKPPMHVSYYELEALSDATICRLHPAQDDWGLRIFIRPPASACNILKFPVHVHVRLPAADSDSPLKIENLSTALPQFTHHIEDIGDTAYPVEAKSVAGNLLLTKSMNGAIRGMYNSSTLLVLDTSNTLISMNVNLLNGNEMPAQQLSSVHPLDHAVPKKMLELACLQQHFLGGNDNGIVPWGDT